MKKLVLLVFSMTASFAIAQTQQSGIPAKLLAANGREIAVYLQGMEGENIAFQLYRSNSTQEVASRLISKITFVLPLDEEGVTQLLSDGEYQGLMDKLETELRAPLDEYWPCMFLENNYAETFAQVMQAYIQMGDISRAMDVSAILLQNPDPAVNGPAQSIAILAALGDGRVEEAESMLDNVESIPGSLYLKACVERAKGELKSAIQLTSELIANYGNDLTWMPQAELLNAHLYMEMDLTNSAINTARQVKSIYLNTSYSADAADLQAEWTTARDEAEAAAKARAEAIEAERAEVAARAQQRAQGVGFGAVSEDSDDGSEPLDQSAEEAVPEEDGDLEGDSVDEDPAETEL